MSEETTETNRTSAKSETVTIRKDTLWKYSTVILAVALILVVAFGIGGKSTTGNVVNNGAAAAPSPTAKVTVPIGDSYIKGSSTAKVAVLEYSDYQCPFCQRFWQQTLPALDSMIEDGEIMFAFKDFPLEQIHPMALPAANAARCVGEQGGSEAYYQFHDLAFQNQQTLSVANFKTWASELGYNVDSCIDSNEYADQIRAELQEGASAGVRGTPGTIVGTVKGDKVEGRLISGACPASEFQKAIQAEMEGKDWVNVECLTTVF